MENDLIVQEQENDDVIIPDLENTDLMENKNKVEIQDASKHIVIPNGINIDEIFEKVLKVPGVRIDRNAFLKILFAKLSKEDINRILEVGPIEAGVSREDLKRIAKRLVGERTALSTGASFLAGMPGGVAIAATIPADLAQYFIISFWLAQELAYLYGQPDIWDEGLENQEEVKIQMMLYCGAMLGAQGATAAVRVLSSAIAKQAMKKLPGMALTKTMIYPLVKGVAKVVGAKMTKEVFAKGVSQVIPVVGGVVSGGITLASMLPMGLKLADTLDKANFDYSKDEINQDLETIKDVGENHVDQEIKVQVDDIVGKLKEKIEKGKEKDWASEFNKIKEKIKIKPEKDWMEELKKAKELLDAGILSEEEFTILKTKLLEKL